MRANMRSTPNRDYSIDPRCARRCRRVSMRALVKVQSLCIIAMLAFFTIHPDGARAADRGVLVHEQVYGRAIEGNLLGDSPDRRVLVYLPPSYQSDTQRRYPVVYLLHGNGGHAEDWLAGTPGKASALLAVDSMDQLIASGAVREMILVMPDCHNRYGGAHYLDNEVTGNWGRFVASDLVNFIDAKYRTVAAATSRGITGGSMGGAGALRVAMANPDTFSAAYSMSGGMLGFDNRHYPGWMLGDAAWKKVVTLDHELGTDHTHDRAMSFVTAFSPNAKNPPLFVDFPFHVENDRLVRVDAVWQRWLELDPLRMIERGTLSPKRLKAIAFDCGWRDVLVIDGNRRLHESLKRSDVPHSYAEYDGDHGSGWGERFRKFVLPFFSEQLSASPPDAVRAAQ